MPKIGGGGDGVVTTPTGITGSLSRKCERNALMILGAPGGLTARNARRSQTPIPPAPTPNAEGEAVGGERRP